MKIDALALTFMSSLLIASLLVTSTPSLKAAGDVPYQQWSKKYGPLIARSVFQTADGGYIVAGAKATLNFRGYTGDMPLLIKTDSSGEIQWSKTYGPEFGVNGWILSVFRTEDLGYVSCGTNWVLKTDTNGNVQWNKTLEQIDAFRVIQASDKGYIVVGKLSSDDTSHQVPVLLKTDENGNSLWNKTFSTGSFAAWAASVVETIDGDYVVSGTLGADAWLAKTDDSGNLLWNQTYHHVDGANGFQGGSIAKTEDGGYILSGEEGRNACLIKIDSEGEEQWHFNYVSGESESSRLASVVELVDGGYIAVGYSAFRAFLVRADASGTRLWNSTYGEDWQYEVYSVVATDDGGFVVAGSMDDNVWLAKFTEVTILQTEQLITIAVIVAAVIAAGLGFLIYLIKRK